MDDMLATNAGVFGPYKPIARLKNVEARRIVRPGFYCFFSVLVNGRDIGEVFCRHRGGNWYVVQESLLPVTEEGGMIAAIRRLDEDFFK